MAYKGSCHCGKTTYDVDGEIEQVIECNCSVCSKKGYLLWFVPRVSLRLHSPIEDLATYTFNKHHIKHEFCPTCGAAPFGIGTDRQGNPMAAINVRCLEGLDLSGLKRVPYDGRSA
ncbi:MAG TPA: GFA family protein [Rhodanobacteraceae bacterium]|nr:GFA family protein [Rhodanobacteraceae bacterium]